MTPRPCLDCEWPAASWARLHLFALIDVALDQCSKGNAAPYVAWARQSLWAMLASSGDPAQARAMNGSIARPPAAGHAAITAQAHRFSP